MGAKIVNIFARLLLSALAALHVRSYFTADVAGLAMGGKPCAEMLSHRGRLAIAAHGRDYSPAERPFPPFVHRTALPYRGDALLRTLDAFADRRHVFAGAGYVTTGRIVLNTLASPPPTTIPAGVILYLPYWLLALIASLPLLATVYRRRRAAVRWAAGHCPACGYDLRSSPDRCPECGEAPPATSTR